MSNYLLEYEKELTTITPAVIEDRFVRFLENELPTIKQWIKDRWLKGERPDGSVIGVYSSLDYEMYKASLGRTGAVDLTLSGDMGDSIDGSYYKMEMEIFSTVPYYEKIVEQYGYDNFNITEEEKEVLLSIVGESVINYYFSELWRV